MNADFKRKKFFPLVQDNSDTVINMMADDFCVVWNYVIPDPKSTALADPRNMDQDNLEIVHDSEDMPTAYYRFGPIADKTITAMEYPHLIMTRSIEFLVGLVSSFGKDGAKNRLPLLAGLMARLGGVNIEALGVEADEFRIPGRRNVVGPRFIDVIINKHIPRFESNLVGYAFGTFSVFAAALLA